MFGACARTARRGGLGFWDASAGRYRNGKRWPKHCVLHRFTACFLPLGKLRACLRTAGRWGGAPDGRIRTAKSDKNAAFYRLGLLLLTLRACLCMAGSWGEPRTEVSQSFARGVPMERRCDMT